MKIQNLQHLKIEKKLIDNQPILNVQYQADNRYQSFNYELKNPDENVEDVIATVIGKLIDIEKPVETINDSN